MAEFLRPSSESSTERDKDDASESKSPGKKRGLRFAAGVESAPAAPKRLKAEGLFSALLEKKDIKLDIPSVTPETRELPADKKPESKPKDTADAEPSQPRLTESGEIITTGDEPETETPHVAASERDTDGVVYELLPNPRLDANMLNGSEIIIPLHGEGPVISHVIELQHDAPAVPVPEVPVQAMYNAQPEQQHQAQTVQTAPETFPPAFEDLPSVGSGEVPPVEPPEALRPFFGQPPEQPPRSPAEVPEPVLQHAYMQSPPLSPNVQVSASGEPLVTKREMKAEVERARRQGSGAALLWAFIAYYEHRKHRKREKRQEKVQKATNKELKKAREDFKFSSEDQTKKQNRVEDELRKTQQQMEADRVNRLAAEKLARANTEQTLAEKQLEIPEGHRLDMQGAYTEEIDKATGKRAEQAVFKHGREYYEDRAKEAAPKSKRNAAAGEVALVAAALNQSASSAPGGSAMLPNTIPNATVQGASPSRSTATKSTTKTDEKPYTQPLWPWLLALAVVAVCLVLVLR